MSEHLSGQQREHSASELVEHLLSEIGKRRRAGTLPDSER